MMRMMTLRPPGLSYYSIISFNSLSMRILVNKDIGD
jgi:hypothetical protein